ncbi:5-dehydro-2-deoxygluconokinase [Sphingobium sp. ZW T5_29]|uniref:bifunctional 5-dehydro-2-deoxygluconokinase/5-dehydro-2- deoxyphosphogluconate aldolase n=1 Tax=Sphingobium sp. ZW T5_29 TaxID=3378077 RepID=UPI00385374FF
MSGFSTGVRALDLITLGRSGVDLYGEQVGGLLEDMGSFAKYVGGSPTNSAIGAARLGLDVGIITRVGSDHMGRFIRQQLEAEGVDVTGVVNDPERLTALVILGIRDPESFPLIFYRENCADMALCEEDIDPGYVASARALLINGTHLSQPDVRAATLKAVHAIKAAGGRVVFDIDYRPVLWGLASKDNGEDRFVSNAQVTQELQQVLPLCDLIVGTEEEIHILGGTTDTVAALRNIRENSGALLVCKRGPDGCVAFPAGVPDQLDQGVVGKGFAIEVFNVLGAGDAFMAGFLRGWLRDESIEQCCTYGNACGAIVVSRHGCAPAQPSAEELRVFLSRNDWPLRLRDSAALEHVHWATNRLTGYDKLTVLAIDHRAQFDELVEELGTNNLDRVTEFKELALRAMAQVAGGEDGFGLLADGRYGRSALEGAAGGRYWIGRPIELPGSRPLRFEGGREAATILADWPLDHVVKCLVFYHPDDPADLRAEQDRQILSLFEACRATRHEMLLEVIASKNGPVESDTVAQVIEHIYGLGVYPDWWKLEPAVDPATWTAIEKVIAANDPYCRGILLLGLASDEETLLAGFAATANSPMVKGFAVGRTIWVEPAMRWFKDEIDDDTAIAQMAASFSVLARAWRDARQDTAS